MEELGFQPNMLARGLRGTHTKLIGVCVQELDSPILARKMACLQSLIRAAGYRGIIELTEGDPALEEEVVRHFFSMRVEGVVLVGPTLASGSVLARQMAEGEVPVVAVDPREALPVARVVLDREHAMELKVEHLHGFGHRRFAVLAVGSDRLYGAQRMRGLQRAARRLGLDVARDFVFFDLEGYGLQDYRYGYELGRRVLAMGEAAPTGLIALNDRIAIGVLRALHEAGRRVPEDFSLIGFDNLDVTEWTEPTLSSIDQQIHSVMSKAVALLMRGAQQEEVRKRAPRNTVKPRLFARGSTGPAPRPVPCPVRSR